MAETVLITTHELEPAVRLKNAFEKEGYAVELLTSGERIADVSGEPALLILTGGLEEKRARRLAREAATLDHLPALGLADSPAQAGSDSRRRLGLADCFVKPADVDDISLVGRRIMERRRLRAITGIVGETDAMREVLERVIQIAPVNATVLVTGESGTGKELVARGLHALSPRRHKPFIAANVAALPEALLESELFGHEKGAFTGAIAQRKGLFELAHKGTLFLDEIAEMQLSTQSKLLRVLESREFMRVGGEQPISIDVRVVAATNQNLRQLVELGDFRRDLYYRLNVLSIQLPPLRERREDIPLLLDTFIKQAAEEHDRPNVVLSQEALSIFLEHDWPGNVREMKNLVESMVVLAPGRVIGPHDIPPELRVAPSPERTLLPVPAAKEMSESGSGPALEFIFRSLLHLRMDVEDLRRKFDEFRRANPDVPGPMPLSYPYPLERPSLAAPHDIEDAQIEGNHNQSLFDEDEDGVGDEGLDEGVVLYRPGMTMQEIEREAIAAALREVRGNRRKAADLLGIGERTLYRKIKEYEIA